MHKGITKKRNFITLGSFLIITLAIICSGMWSSSANYSSKSSNKKTETLSTSKKDSALNNTINIGGTTGIVLDWSVKPNRIYVTNTTKNQILGWSNVADFRNGQAPTLTIGGENNSTLLSPMGLTIDEKGNLFVADSGHNRVVRFDTPFSSDVTPDAIYSDGLDSATAITIGGLFTDAPRLYVADKTKHQVTAFTLDDQKPVGSISVASPEGLAASFGGVLYVTDSSTNQVLAYGDLIQSPRLIRSFTGPGNKLKDEIGKIPFNGLSGITTSFNGGFFVADSGNKRAFEYQTPLYEEAFEADRVYNLANLAIAQETTALTTDQEGNLYVATQSSISVLPPQSVSEVLETSNINNNTSNKVKSPSFEKNITVAPKAITTFFTEIFDFFNPASHPTRVDAAGGSIGWFPRTSASAPLSFPVGPTDGCTPNMLPGHSGTKAAAARPQPTGGIGSCNHSSGFLFPTDTTLRFVNPVISKSQNVCNPITLNFKYLLDVRNTVGMAVVDIAEVGVSTNITGPYITVADKGGALNNLNNFAGVWQSASVVLDPSFAGKDIFLRFRLNSVLPVFGGVLPEGFYVDDIEVTADSSPALTANAGTDQTICAGNTTLLTATPNPLPAGATGFWTVVAGGNGTFSAPNQPVTTFTHTSGVGPITLRWTVVGPSCAGPLITVSDDVIIGISQPPTKADAGPDQKTCLSGGTATITLAGNTPTSGIGTWTAPAGLRPAGSTVTFVNINNPTTNVTVNRGGKYTFVWTIANAPCPNSSDTMDLIVGNTPVAITSITVTPANVVRGGNPVEIEINATGNDLKFQWFYDQDCGGPILPVAINNGDRGGRIVIVSDPTTITTTTGKTKLTINNSIASDSGCYFVEATGICGKVTSNSTQITIVGTELPALYVADTGNNRIQRSSDGGVTWEVLTGGPGTLAFSTPESVTYFPNIQDLFNRSKDIIYVADTGNSRIMKSTNGGNTWTVLAENGGLITQVNNPQGLALDTEGNLYISDTGNSRVIRYRNGVNSSINNRILATRGTAPGQVNTPNGLIVDLNFNLYVTDVFLSKVIKIANANTTVVADTGTIAVGPMQVKTPQGVAADSDGNLFIADTGNNRVTLFNNVAGTLTFGGVLISNGTSIGKVLGPEGVTISRFVNGPFANALSIVVSDTQNYRMQGSLNPTAPAGWTIIGNKGPLGSPAGLFATPSKCR